MQKLIVKEKLIVSIHSPARMYKCRVKRAENLFGVFFLLWGEKWKSFLEEKMATKEKSIKFVKDFRCRDLPTASTYKMEIRILAVDQSLFLVYPIFRIFNACNFECFPKFN